MRRLQINLNEDPVLMIHRRALRKRKLVYVLAAKNSVKYRAGRSRIVYIGTTKKGVKRIAESAAKRATKVMSTRGLKELNAYVVSCGGRTGVPTWRKLEDALLAEFRAEYEALPKGNSQGKKKRWTDDLDQMFKQKAIRKVLGHFDESK